ncbi:MAG: IPT/TIG domain-containing protein [Nitrospirales bacterium]|nr:IPT/TIG domain-containing protein [Nitrospirales bacterium]
MNIRYSYAFLLFALITLWIMDSVGPEGLSLVLAQGVAQDGTIIPKAIEGFDEQKVKADPVCDSSRRPHISKVEPDELNVGDKVVITGKDFGRKKECFLGISFGSEPAKTFSYVDDGKAEAVVPERAPAGLTFLNLMTSGGTARKGILVK